MLKKIRWNQTKPLSHFINSNKLKRASETCHSRASTQSRLTGGGGGTTSSPHLLTTREWAGEAMAQLYIGEEASGGRRLHISPRPAENLKFYWNKTDKSDESVQLEALIWLKMEWFKLFEIFLDQDGSSVHFSSFGRLPGSDSFS